MLGHAQESHLLALLERGVNDFIHRLATGVARLIIARVTIEWPGTWCDKSKSGKPNQPSNTIEIYMYNEQLFMYIRLFSFRSY